MTINKSKINLTNKICSILFFVFTIINFTLSILVMVNINGNQNSKTSLNILNYGLTLTFIISLALNIYLVIGMLLVNKNNYKNAMLYILGFIALFALISYIYCFININKKYTNTLTTEFWLLLVASGLSVLFGGWYCLISWNLLRELIFNNVDEQLEEQSIISQSDETIEQEQDNSINN